MFERLPDPCFEAWLKNAADETTSGPAFFTLWPLMEIQFSSISMFPSPQSSRTRFDARVVEHSRFSISTQSKVAIATYPVFPAGDRMLYNLDYKVETYLLPPPWEPKSDRTLLSTIHVKRFG
jgi:hypothetical protein